jgi:hypothetical protein
MGSGITVKDTISPTCAYMVATIPARAEQEMRDQAQRVQQYAQDNAPWSDRTGDARSGLIADVYQDGGEIVLELAHSVDYGQWLELIEDGRFAILLPTIEAMGAEVINRAGGVVLETGML